MVGSSPVTFLAGLDERRLGQAPRGRRGEVWRSQIVELEIAQRSFEDTLGLGRHELLDRLVDRPSPGGPGQEGYGYNERHANHQPEHAQWAKHDRVEDGDRVMLPARRGRLRSLSISGARDQKRQRKGCSYGSQA